ncbi:MAG: O-methyltransferase [Elusimicrobiales bacterium]
MEKFYPQSLDEKSCEYFISHINSQDRVYEKIKLKAEKLNIKNISLSPFDAAVVGILTSALKPLKAIEIGCFLGYSAITIARNMPDDGRLYTIEKDDTYADSATEIIREEKLDEKITVINDDAENYLSKLSKISKFELCFIDADKDKYPFYLKWALKNIKSGGMIIAHNVFLKGKLFYDGEDKEQNKKSRGMKEFLYIFFNNDSFSSRAIIPTQDGLAVGILK